jgi:EAL domain-containing protein (putative c-di-GMP-specific phosphodiesterase class I)
MKYNSAVLYDLVMAAFDEAALSAFCFERARPVYNLFAPGQTHSQRARLLIEHTVAQNNLEEILGAIERANPYQYSAFHRRITGDDDPVQSSAGKRLPRAMQRYDAFFERWAGALTDLDVSPHNFARSLIASLTTALQARTGFVLEHRDVTWEPTIALDERAVRDAHSITESNSIRDMLNHALQRHTVLYTEPSSGDESLICAPLIGARSPALLVFVGLNGAPGLDEMVEVTLETILATTRNLTEPVDGESLELHVYDALRRRIGRVSDAMYNRQFDLYCRRLQRMTVYFEPIVYLHPTQPYIWGWEALARDPATNRAPVDLFRIADLWGTRFQLACDLHFLHRSIEAYTFRSSRRARREEMQTLTVNAYPVSLMRTRYEETLRHLYLHGPMPLNKLIIEISEKPYLPLPDAPDVHGDSHTRMRERLQHLERFDVRFAIDDFGAGMASPERLTRLGVAVVKIDRNALLHRFGDSTIQYVIDFARSVPGYVQVIIEGVDHDSFFPLRALFDARVRYVQGHQLGVARPDIDRLSIEEVEYIRGALQAG